MHAIPRGHGDFEKCFCSGVICLHGDCEACAYARANQFPITLSRYLILTAAISVRLKRLHALQLSSYSWIKAIINFFNGHANTLNDEKGRRSIWSQKNVLQLLHPHSSTRLENSVFKFSAALTSCISYIRSMTAHNMVQPTTQQSAETVVTWITSCLQSVRCKKGLIWSAEQCPFSYT